MPTIVLADDHVAFSEGIARVLQGHFEVVGTVVDGSGLCEAVGRLHPDVVVTDISMPHLSGLDGIRQLRSSGNRTPAVVLTMHANARIAAEAFQVGANGFVLKHTSGEELLTAIAAVLTGRTYMSPELSEEVAAAHTNPAANPDEDLTVRQREVLRLLVEGKRIKEIASLLNLSGRTVETIKYDIMRVLGVESTPMLVRYAIEHHLVPG